MAQDRLLLADGASNLLLADDSSVLLLTSITAGPVEADPNPVRRFYRPDNRESYDLDARTTYRVDGRRTYRSR